VPAAERNIDAESSQPSIAPNRLRVLIADDERDTVITLMELLGDEGYQVRGVYKGRDVIAAMRDFDPDAVLLDLAMPDLSGWEVAREIRARYGDKRPLLVAISGQYKQAADKLLGQLAGFNYHVAKPCDPKALVALLSELPRRIP
jgi:DNA-binding response OmpR family regulator